VVKAVVVHGPTHQEMHRRHHKHPNSLIKGSLEVESYLKNFSEIKLESMKTSENLMTIK
jgi:hypothetical protein